MDVEGRQGVVSGSVGISHKTSPSFQLFHPSQATKRSCVLSSLCILFLSDPRATALTHSLGQMQVRQRDFPTTNNHLVHLTHSVFICMAANLAPHQLNWSSHGERSHVHKREMGHDLSSS